MTALSDSYFSLRAYLIAWEATPFFPFDISEPPEDSLLDRLYFSELSTQCGEDNVSLTLQMLWESGEGAVIPLLQAQGIALVLGSGEATALTLGAIFASEFFSFTVGTDIAVRIDSELIRPVELVDGRYQVTEGAYEVGFGDISLTLDSDGNIALGNVSTVAIDPFALGDLGLVIDPEEVTFCFGSQAADDLAASYPDAQLTSSFRGIFVPNGTCFFPEDFPIESLNLRDAFIGNYGFTGVLTFGPGDDPSAIVTRPSAFGLDFNLESVSIELVQNVPTGGGISGEIKLPFFDEFVGVTLSLGVDGSFYVALNQADERGLVELNIPGVATFQLSSLGLVSDDEGVGVLLSGALQLEVGSPELQWPEIQIQNLRIAPDGRVTISGGWLDLQEPVALDLYGFRLEISAIGFGSEEDGHRWIGFSGGVHLVDMLPTGVSVEGLRIIWDPADPQGDVSITLQGVGLELTIPGVLQLKGDVALFNLGADHHFEGNAKLDLLPLGIGLDAAVKIGHDDAADYNYVYTFLSLQLPIGIPLWATGAALYGLSGLYGMNVSSNTEGGDWYGWYTDIPKFDVTDTGKWDGQLDGRAFGAGMVLGTLFDAGLAVSAKALFAMVLPGPTILLNGKANLLQLPPELSDPDSAGIFNALAVLDAQAGKLQLDIDASWSLARVIDINASAEAYFDFANPRNWHLYLGQNTPEDRRIRAYVLCLFHADAYLMIDSQGIAAGFGVNWGQDWRFGPVKVVARAWIEAGAAITWQPPQLEGSLSLGGEFEVSVAGFGAGLSCEAILSGKAPTLYWVRGELQLRVKLPPPFKDLEQEILLEWKEDKEPPIEPPVISIGLEHPKVDETWTNLKNVELAPTDTDYDGGPIVPLDARPAITFDRSMKDMLTDVALTSVNVYSGGTRVGEYTFDYELRSLTLDKWSKAAGTSWLPVLDLSGCWMAIEDGNGEPAASKLQLWTKSPFAFTRRSSRTYRDAFLAAHQLWPCAEHIDPAVICVNWEPEIPSPGDEIEDVVDIHSPGHPPSSGLALAPPSVGHIPGGGPTVQLGCGPTFIHENLTFIVETVAEVVPVNSSKCGVNSVLRLEDAEVCWIVFPEPVRNVSLCLDGLFENVNAYANGIRLERINDPEQLVYFNAAGIDSIKLKSWDNAMIGWICYETEATAEVRESTNEHIDRIVAGLAVWNSAEEILEPETLYRIGVTVATVRSRDGSKDETEYPAIYGYFQTDGPPGLVPSWDGPAEVEPTADEHGTETTKLSEKPYPEGGQLTDLSKYVQWSIPAHGAAPVYRAYDVGVDFNEDYVEQMYGADMIVRLLDVNGLPILDEEGNEVSLANQWAEAPTAELSETELPYVTRIENCRSLPGYSLLPNQKLLASSGILFEEDFSGDLEQWREIDSDPLNPNPWKVADGKLNLSLASSAQSLLVAGDKEWSDYAVEVQLGDEGSEVGLVFRYNQVDEESYYRLRFDAHGRHFERVSNGTVTALWEDAIAYSPESIDTVGVQCEGTRMRGQIDNELLFDLRDEDGIVSGSVGIYANAVTATFEHFLVRQWPGGALKPQTSYAAQLLASFVLFQGGLTSGGWIDTEFNWRELTRSSNKSHIAALGREDWGNYRVEVNVKPNGNVVGLFVRFQLHEGSGAFDGYRLALDPVANTLQLVRLHGTYSESTNTYETDASGETLLWPGDSEASGVNFNLTEHSLALSCVGSTLIIEADGQELARVTDHSANPLRLGQGGLYSEGGNSPIFTDLIVRSAPRQPVYNWGFITSQFEGLVEQLDSFIGEVDREDAIASEKGLLATAISDALAGMEQANNSLNAARRALSVADAKDVDLLRTKAQEAAAARQAEAARHFATLDELLFESAFRPIPPIVEVTEVFKQTKRRALLLESSEPLDWQRLTVRLARLDERSQLFIDLANVLFVWNEDGTRAFIALGREPNITVGEYRLHFERRLDLGPEASVLRRSGSTLPEVAAIVFSLAS